MEWAGKKAGKMVEGILKKRGNGIHEVFFK